MQYNRNILAQQANDLGFVRDTFEKVCRLIDVLTTFENDTYLSAKLALKGGTAINLAIFDFPRLSVDIDLDFSENVSREEMLTQRKIITNRIDKSMVAAGYISSKKSKITHALDSLVFEYINAGGVVDNLKIEINYMLRSHVLPLTKKTSSFHGVKVLLHFILLPLLRYLLQKSLPLSTELQSVIYMMSIT